jgi:hypothetical protein
MFTALFFAGLIVVATVGGKACFLLLTTQPIIGPLADWYMGYVGPIGDGFAANLIYDAMASQLLLIALSPILYGRSIRLTHSCSHRNKADFLLR